VYDSNPDWRWPETGVDRSSAKHDIPDWLSIERERLKKEWRLANKIVCWSEWGVECVMQDGVPRDKCFVVPPMFEPSPAYASCAPRYEAEPFTVIFLGTLCLRKGTHDLIEAVALAAQSAPVRLILAGPNQLNPAMLKRHRDFIDYRGFIPHRELPSLLSQGHVLALPSYSEGFGMVQLEAMAAGLPVIRSTNTGDAARDGREGIALCAGDRNALANAILMLARDRQRLEEMSHMSRLRIDDFSMEATARRWHAVIMNLLT
jgi:glycosyltransferase involved in cell wall biosynthesis